MGVRGGLGEVVDALTGAALIFVFAWLVALLSYNMAPCGAVGASMCGEAAAAAAGLLYSWRRGLLREFFHPPRLGAARLLGLAGAGVGAMLLLAPILSPAPSPVEHEVFTCVESHPVLMGFTLLFLAPFTEELCFRGLIQGRLSRVIGGPAALLAASLAFYAAHVYALGAAGALVAFVEGIVLGVPVLLGDSLWAPILIHSLLNLVGFVAAV